MPSRIIFINPAVDKSRYEWEYGLGSRLPAIGLCSLAAYTRQHGFETALLDSYNLGLSEELTLEKVLEFSPTHVGITATTSYIFFAAKLAQLLKKHRPQIVTVIGGAHISSVPYETMQSFPDFDLGVIGEGEETIKELLSLANPFQGLGNIKGVIYRGNGDGLEKTGPRPYLEDLDRLPHPAWDLLQGFPQYYRPTPSNYRKLPVASLITSRGCPYQCTFCDRSVFGNRFRSFGAEYIIGLIKEIKNRYGVREISFYDDTFTADKARLNKICEALINNDLRLSWSCLGRADLADSDSLTLMKRAGCWSVSYGIESASQDILDLYQKKINLYQVEEAVRMTKAQGIQTRAFFMLGNPMETQNTILQTQSLLRRLSLDDIHISFFMPLPGSDSYKSVEKYGKFSKDWKLMDVYTPNFIPAGLSRGLLLKYRSQLYRSFYLEPRILLRYLTVMLNPKRLFETLKKIIIFIKLINKDK